ncbi:MAG: thiamine pyrophosphate-binding protein [Deltaproteobacteria bacterium]|uniref:Thiamine pyrophosphate-binding protein n=1 Tax=Candidatus Zymogenus saltonus TaxID=2844893 RepID=A0A9D8PRB7_9DELT|nr:thiamine pyrophosphate-binding protein [Candidatus Zymogenus saltonus]
MPEVHGGQLVVKALEEEGISYIFTLSGGHIDKIYDACIDSKIKVIDVRHEQAAAFMAMGWSIASDQLGVCLVTAGPGLANAVTGVMDAQCSHIPMLVIGGRSPRKENDLGALQDVDQMAIMRTVAKSTFLVNDVERIPEYIGVAFRHALSDRPGPVYLEIPVDILKERVDLDTIKFPRPNRAEYKPAGDPKAIDAAAKLLQEAKKPLIIGGGGVRWGNAGEALTKLVEKTNIPFILFNEGRGMVPDTHPMSLWDGGLMGLTFAAAQADVILVLGLRMTWLASYGAIYPNAKIIRVDISGDEVGKNVPHEVGIVGDVGMVTAAIAERIGKCDHSAWAKEAIDTGVAMMAEENKLKDSDASPIHPVRAVSDVYKTFGNKATYSVDGGDVSYFGAVHLKAGGPGQMLSNVGNLMGCLGSGIPLNLAGKLARPDRQAVVVTGDGSFGLNGMEIETSIRHNIPIIIVILNDQAWGMVKHGQELQYNRVVGTDLGPVRYDLMAQGLGAHAEYVTEAKEIIPALKRAQDSKKTAVVNIITDPTVTSPITYIFVAALNV